MPHKVTNLVLSRLFICQQLSELAKLKGIPDLMQLEVSGNPLSDLPHSRLYIIFHLRCVEILDGQQVSAPERDKAHNRFALGKCLF